MNINESSMVGAELLVPCCCESNANSCCHTGCQSALTATGDADSLGLFASVLPAARYESSLGRDEWYPGDKSTDTASSSAFLSCGALTI